MVLSTCIYMIIFLYEYTIVHALLLRSFRGYGSHGACAMFACLRVCVFAVGDMVNSMYVCMHIQ